MRNKLKSTMNIEFLTYIETKVAVINPCSRTKTWLNFEGQMLLFNGY